jgi:hypothetical protein
MNTALYYNSDVGRWHIDQCLITGEKYSDLDVFLQAQYDKKFAILHTPVFTDLTQFELDVQRLANHCNLVILLISEVHDDTVAFIERNHHPNIVSFICGALNSDTPHNQWMDWFITSSDFYRRHNVLNQLQPYEVKPKTFDILLGQPKPHRTFIYDFARDYKDRVIMTYFKDHQTPIKQYGEKSWIWESEGLEVPDDDFSFTVTPVRYYGESMSLSQVVPISIYNQTAYSIICETNFQNHYSFFTEKTVKPILGRRLFLMFGGQYQLENLRKLGFQTFDGIVDESYDTVACFETRAKMIKDQMRYLLSQDQQTILDKIKPITDHNYQVMMSTDWYGDFARELRAVLLDHTN